MQAIVVTFDRLATRLLGCYGNEWIETPNFDRLAADATVFDNHFADTVGCNAGRAWLTGRHALRADSSGESPELGSLLHTAGIASRVIVSNADASTRWQNAGFDRVQVVRGHDGLDVSPERVPFARLVQAARETLKDHAFSADRRLLWLHAAEPGLPPEGFATLYFEDFEERGIAMSDVPREDWPSHLAVAAGGVSLIDHWLGELLSAVESASRDRPTLLMIAAARGRSWLEDFTAVSPSRIPELPVSRLRDQETKSPLILSVHGDRRSTGLTSLRCPRFVQPTDIPATLRDWFEIQSDSADSGERSLVREPVDVVPPREHVCFGDEERCFGIRTRDWSCLMQLGHPDQILPPQIQFGDDDWPSPVQLFVKPDDLWDVTDTSTQQPEVCEQLVRTLNDFRRAR